MAIVVSYQDGQFFVCTDVENTHQRIDVKVVSFTGENTGIWNGAISYNDNLPAHRKEDKWALWSGMCISAMRLENMEKYGLKLEHKGGLKITGTEIISPSIKRILFEGMLEKVEDHSPSVHLQQMMTDLALHMMGPIAAQERNTAALKMQTVMLESEMKRIKELNDTKRTDWLQKTSVLMCEKTREINRLNSIVRSVRRDEYNGDDHGSDAERDDDDDDDDSDDGGHQHMPPPSLKQPLKGNDSKLGSASKPLPSSSSSSSSSSSGIVRSKSATAGHVGSSRTASAGSTSLTQDISFLDLPSGTQEIDAADLRRSLSQLHTQQKESSKKEPVSMDIPPAASSISSSSGAATVPPPNPKKKKKRLMDDSDDSEG